MIRCAGDGGPSSRGPMTSPHHHSKHVTHAMRAMRATRVLAAGDALRVLVV
jgi:hypothetical protein